MSFLCLKYVYLFQANVIQAIFSKSVSNISATKPHPHLRECYDYALEQNFTPDYLSNTSVTLGNDDDELMNLRFEVWSEKLM